MPTNIDDYKVVLDRGRITHRESKRMTVLGVVVQKAQRDLDPDAIEQALEELDALTEKITVSLPKGWGVDTSKSGWINDLTGDQYDAVTDAMRASVPGEKAG